MVKSFRLPQLRQELGIYPAPASLDGSQAWTLHDPTANKFFQLSWPAFEILSRWGIGSSEAVVESVQRETTLSISNDDISHLVLFLEQNYLLETSGSARVAAGLESLRTSWTTWLLKNYLFFRIPLFRPQRFLNASQHWFSWMYTPWFLTAVLLSTLTGLFFVSRQWEVFRHSITVYKTWEGMLALAIAISLAKTAHEFGHAITAHRYGCRIPAMGIAFVVMFPMLYTDTNEVWKLTERRERIAVGVAGMVTELLLAMIATWAWLFLPDGPVRAGAFIMATTTWIMALMLNASPFMRFDGYFILSDMIGIANLHARSFAFGRWWMRKVLFGLNDPPPESVLPKLRLFLITFSYIVWIYRFVIFLGIAILVYHYFFKVLGIILFSVEIWWFTLQPIYLELKAWLNLRSRIKFNFAVFRTACIVIGIIAVLVVPWRGRVTAPAILSAAREQSFYTPLPSMIMQEPARGKQYVQAGDVLINLFSRDLRHRIEQVKISELVSRWEVEHQPFNEEMLTAGQVLQRRLEEAGTELKGRINENAQLTMHAPFSGYILTRNDEIRPGLMLPAREQLYVLVDTTENKVDVFVSALDIKRISVGKNARFIPDGLDFGTYNCRVTEIDRVNITILEEPSLASIYEGPIAAHADTKGQIRPASPLFRIRLGSCTPGNVPMLRLKGVAGIEAEKRSLVIDTLQSWYNILLRESSF